MLSPGTSHTQAMERARAIFSAIRQWLFEQGANEQGERTNDVTHPVSLASMQQVPCGALGPVQQIEAAVQRQQLKPRLSR